MINFLKFKITFLDTESLKKLPKAQTSKKIYKHLFLAFIFGESLKNFHFEYLKLATFRMRLSEIDHCGCCRMVWIETPTNPNLKVVDIQAVADIAHSHENIFVVVDNTFESAYFQR